eukprot:scaffold34256_cov41-Phaeocystis_antarctica.AAC.2
MTTDLCERAEGPQGRTKPEHGRRTDLQEGSPPYMSCMPSLYACRAPHFVSFHDPAQRQNSDQKHQVWPQWLSKAKSCRCQSHSLKPQLTCSDGPQHGLRWSTQPVDEAELAAGRV